MPVADLQGRFQAIESFATEARQECHLIGHLLAGAVPAHWLARIQLNPGFAATARPKQVALVGPAGEAASGLLLLVAAAAQSLGLLPGRRVGPEEMKITVAGEA